MTEHMTDQEKQEYMDLDAGLGRVRGNKKIFKRMLGLFLASDQFDAFEAALAEQDLAKAGEVAHGIKGMTGNLGFNRLFEESNRLMTELRDGVADQALIDSYRNSLEISKELAEQAMAQFEAEGV